jgi:ATP-dependent RNA helicase RhlE
LPKKRNSLFFSATMSQQTGEFAEGFLTDPVHVEAAHTTCTLECIDQSVFFVDQNSKNSLLLELLRDGDMERVLVFARTKHRADKVATMLEKNRIRADAIHGNKSQNQREKAMHNFKSGHIQVLVATDIAARGIDIDDISHVVNYDLPNEPESYVHRIGRTGRAGASGTAFSFCAADERSFLRDIERLTREQIKVAEHQFHSEKAKSAVGAAAKPVPPNRSRVTQRSLQTKSMGKPAPRRSHTARVAY